MGSLGRRGGERVSQVSGNAIEAVKTLLEIKLLMSYQTSGLLSTGVGLKVNFRHHFCLKIKNIEGKNQKCPITHDPLLCGDCFCDSSILSRC